MYESSSMSTYWSAQKGTHDVPQTLHSVFLLTHGNSIISHANVKSLKSTFILLFLPNSQFVNLLGITCSIYLFTTPLLPCWPPNSHLFPRLLQFTPNWSLCFSPLGSLYTAFRVKLLNVFCDLHTWSLSASLSQLYFKCQTQYINALLSL